MTVEIDLGLFFYSKGDEARFFQGLQSIPAVKKVTGLGRGSRSSVLRLDIDPRLLTKARLWDLVALLRRYGIPLAPLRRFAKARKFAWHRQEIYWHRNVYRTPR